VLEQFPKATLIECALDTGRTHQIRVHLAARGHPLLGDPVYGPRGRQAHGFGRQALHALRLGLLHPLDRRELAWTAAIPADFADLLAQLRAR
jgi:23S rRNA pseudouridine1911/1915/1917 synthase